VYGSKKELLEGLEDAVIKPAMLMHDRLINKRAEKMKTKNIKDILKARARR
jgi:hypothetical protein